MNMLKLDRELEFLNELIRRLDALKYQDHSSLRDIGTDTRIFIRRAFGQESVWMHDFERIRFEPEGFIANSEHHLMTRAWDRGTSLLNSLLHGMKKELLRFGKLEEAAEEITVEWLLKHLPLKLWLSLASLLLAAFAAGVSLGQTTFIRELFGK
ncbi:MAG: hypothetical protein FJ388_05090 [Verrucomicrobia bacterium]|nr:hypothetical protein [Verrucomicrobiota bacterium]